MLVYDPKEKTVRTWSHAEIDGPCFVVTITSLQTGETNRAALLRCIYALNHYLLTVKGVEIENIHMMCPPSISGKSHWIMEELLSVTSYNGLETLESTIVYRTKGSVYKIGEFDRRKKNKSRLLYSALHLRDHIAEPLPCPTDQLTSELIGQTA